MSSDDMCLNNSYFFFDSTKVRVLYINTIQRSSWNRFYLTSAVLCPALTKQKAHSLSARDDEGYRVSWNDTKIQSLAGDLPVNSMLRDRQMHYELLGSAGTMKNDVLWDVMPFGSCNHRRRHYS
jgi:hypothetical protein